MGEGQRMTDATATIDRRQSERKVILASSLGTVFEWYDFYLYGLLATIISAQFFSGVNETTGFIFALAAFAAAADRGLGLECDVQRSGVCAVDDNVSGSIMPTRAIRRECGDRRLFFGFMVRDALRKLVLSGIITPLFSIAQTAGSSMAMMFPRAVG